MVLDEVVRAAPVTAGTLDAWWTATAPIRARHATVDRALVGGASSDRLGFAFAGGYAAALAALVPAVDGQLVSLCATEDKGAHPRAIHTRLEDNTLTGRKRWATVGNLATSLLVVATTGDGPDGVPRLRVARISARAPGLTVTPTTAPFVPEIPHAELALDRVPVEEVLPGDGYLDYLKPFRTVEDLHVHAALLGYLAGVARRQRFPQLERLLALAAAVRDLAAQPRDAAVIHLALGGLIELVQPVVVELEHRWSPLGGDEHARWVRDRPLLNVAAAARAARLDKARSSL